MWAERQTDMMRLIVILRNFGNEPKSGNVCGVILEMSSVMKEGDIR